MEILLKVSQARPDTPTAHWGHHGGQIEHTKTAPGIALKLLFRKEKKKVVFQNHVEVAGKVKSICSWTALKLHWI